MRLKSKHYLLQNSIIDAAKVDRAMIYTIFSVDGKALLTVWLKNPERQINFSFATTSQAVTALHDLYAVMGRTNKAPIYYWPAFAIMAIAVATYSFWMPGGGL